MKRTNSQCCERLSRWRGDTRKRRITFYTEKARWERGQGPTRELQGTRKSRLSAKEREREAIWRSEDIGCLVRRCHFSPREVLAVADFPISREISYTGQNVWPEATHVKGTDWPPRLGQSSGTLLLPVDRLLLVARICFRCALSTG